jgi:serine phosphatase RsbU (regulator of sigma subunit)
MLAKHDSPSVLQISIGTKLAGAVLGLLVLVSVVVQQQVSRHEREGLIHAKELAASAVVRLFADSCEAPVVFDDHAAIGDALNALGHDPEVQYAAVWLVREGKLAERASELKRGPSEPAPGLTDGVALQRHRDRVVVLAPVRALGKQVVATVVVAFSLAHENRAIAQVERSTLWASAAVGVVLGVLLIGVTRLTVVRPLAKLVVAAEQLERGQSAELDITSGDELGVLAKAFLSMSQAIRSREATVRERTEALNRTLQELWAEMDLARKIQTVLLPQAPQLAGFEVAAEMVPASTVGGDYYDVVQTGEVSWILVGDVAGHGVTAGLTMMIVQTAVRAVIHAADVHAQELTPRELLTQVNAAVRVNMQKIGDEQYMTIMALRIERGVLTFSGLHQDLLVRRAATGAVERFESRGVWLGLMDDISELLELDEITLQSGDLLLMYTDGVTESAGDAEALFGTAGLSRLLTDLAADGGTPASVVKGVIAHACRTPPEDDVTVLAARYGGPLVMQNMSTHVT